MTTVYVDGSIRATLPDKCIMTEYEHQVLERRVQAFIHWELNEFVRIRTGKVNFYGPCEMEEKANAYKKES